MRPVVLQRHLIEVRLQMLIPDLNVAANCRGFLVLLNERQADLFLELTDSLR